MFLNTYLEVGMNQTMNQKNWWIEQVCGSVCDPVWGSTFAESRWSAEPIPSLGLVLLWQNRCPFAPSLLPSSFPCCHLYSCHRHHLRQWAGFFSRSWLLPLMMAVGGAEPDRDDRDSGKWVGRQPFPPWHKPRKQFMNRFIFRCVSVMVHSLWFVATHEPALFVGFSVCAHLYSYLKGNKKKALINAILLLPMTSLMLGWQSYATGLWAQHPKHL